MRSETARGARDSDEEGAPDDEPEMPASTGASAPGPLQGKISGPKDEFDDLLLDAEELLIPAGVEARVSVRRTSMRARASADDGAQRRGGAESATAGPCHSTPSKFVRLEPTEVAPPLEDGPRVATGLQDCGTQEVHGEASSRSTIRALIWSSAKGGGWQHDLLNDAFFSPLRCWAWGGRIAGLLAGFPCQTVSRARHRPGGAAPTPAGPHAAQSPRGQRQGGDRLRGRCTGPQTPAHR